MDVILNISSEALDDDDLQSLTSDLCTTLSREADVTATLAEESVSGGARGLGIVLGTIIITFLSRGSPPARREIKDRSLGSCASSTSEAPGQGGLDGT